MTPRHPAEQPLALDRFHDALGRGDATRRAARYADAIDAYREALGARGDDAAAGEAADIFVRIAECHIELGAMEAAEVALADAAACNDGRLLPSVQGALHVARGYVALNRARYEETVREATTAWDVLRETGENALLARALNCRGHGLRRLGRLAEAREDFLDAMAAARRAENAHEVGLASSNLGFLLWQRGEYFEARGYHRRAVEVHESCGSETHLSRELFALAVDEFHVGSWTESAALLERVGERARKTGDRRLEVAVLIQSARLELARGEDPRELLETAGATARAEGYAHDLVLIGQVLGDAAMERGDWEVAARVLGETWMRAKSSSPNGEPGGDTAWRLALAEDRLGDPNGRVLDLLGRALESAGAREYRAQEALVRRSLAITLARRGRTEDARRHFEAAVATLRVLRMPHETARTLLAMGDALEETTAIREARSIFTELQAVREERRAAEALASRTGESLVDLDGSGGVMSAGVGSGAGDPFGAIVTCAPAMETAIERARRIAPARIPVLLTGETGTGKELFARAIHASSPCRRRPFLAVNCAALTETLLEAELFGHVRGAFTGAVGDRAGIFEAADGGTVFLDEIGKAPRSLQAKLLRVVDTGEMRRVGGVDAIRVTVRIVAATNRELRELVREGEFLSDLYYRLRGFEISVPPLRERAGDVALLFERYAGRPATQAALELLERHDWPGNVRELKHLAESAAFVCGGRHPISCDALPDWIREADEGARVPRLADVERTALVDALARSGGNRARAARELGISRQALYSKIARLGIGEEGRLTNVA